MQGSTPACLAGSKRGVYRKDLARDRSLTSGPWRRFALAEPPSETVRHEIGRSADFRSLAHSAPCCQKARVTHESAREREKRAVHLEWEEFRQRAQTACACSARTKRTGRARGSERAKSADVCCSSRRYGKVQNAVRRESKARKKNRPRPAGTRTGGARLGSVGTLSCSCLHRSRRRSRGAYSAGCTLIDFVTLRHVDSTVSESAKGGA